MAPALLNTEQKRARALPPAGIASGGVASGPRQLAGLPRRASAAKRYLVATDRDIRRRDEREAPFVPHAEHARGAREGDADREREEEDADIRHGLGRAIRNAVTGAPSARSAPGGHDGNRGRARGREKGPRARDAGPAAGYLEGPHRVRDGMKSVLSAGTM